MTKPQFKQINDLFKLSQPELRKFFNDLTTHQQLTNDLYQILADCMDPHSQSIIILEPQSITDSASKQVIKTAYQATIPTINQLNPHFSYQKRLHHEDLPVIIIKQADSDNSAKLNVLQVLPFNLVLGFSTPVALNDPHLLTSGIQKEIKPQIDRFIHFLLINWLNFPWLIHYRLSHPKISIDQLFDHSIKQYQLKYLRAGMSLTFNLAQQTDESAFDDYLKSLSLPTVIKINHLRQLGYSLQLNCKKVM